MGDYFPVVGSIRNGTCDVSFERGELVLVDMQIIGMNVVLQMTQQIHEQLEAVALFPREWFELASRIGGGNHGASDMQYSPVGRAYEPGGVWGMALRDPPPEYRFPPLSFFMEDAKEAVKLNVAWLGYDFHKVADHFMTDSDEYMPSLEVILKAHSHDNLLKACEEIMRRPRQSEEVWNLTVDLLARHRVGMSSERLRRWWAEYGHSVWFNLLDYTAAVFGRDRAAAEGIERLDLLVPSGGDLQAMRIAKFTRTRDQAANMLLEAYLDAVPAESRRAVRRKIRERIRWWSFNRR